MVINFLRSIDKAFAFAIKTLLVIFLLTMVFLVGAQVIMRNLVGGGFTWSDEMARSMVLWVAFYGAILATRRRQHIAIDILTRFIPDTPKYFVRIFLDAFCSIVAFYLAKASYFFVLDERIMESTSFAQLPTWIIQTIIPFGFAMISLEYLVGIGIDIYNVTLTPPSPPPNDRRTGIKGEGDIESPKGGLPQ